MSVSVAPFRRYLDLSGITHQLLAEWTGKRRTDVTYDLSLRNWGMGLADCYATAVGHHFSAFWTPVDTHDRRGMLTYERGWKGSWYGDRVKVSA